MLVSNLDNRIDDELPHVFVKFRGGSVVHKVAGNSDRHRKFTVPAVDATELDLTILHFRDLNDQVHAVEWRLREQPRASKMGLQRVTCTHDGWADALQTDFDLADHAGQQNSLNWLTCIGHGVGL